MDKNRQGVNSLQFNSIPFLFGFLPVFLAVYYFVPDKLRNLVLAVGSAVFYGFSVRSMPWMLAVVTILILGTYFAGIFLYQRRSSRVLGLVLGSMGAGLVFFKCYSGGMYMTAGLSFYLFQMAAYLIRIFQGKLRPERDLLSYSAQILMFPKLLSGPLMDPEDLMRQMHRRRYTLRSLHRGLQDLIVGLAMKVLLADRLGGLWAQAAVVGYEYISPIFAWLALAAFAMRLYFDFHGYSLMAVGIGRMLGFSLPRNFNDPYVSKSVSEFYRRWHRTLGAWFRECVYIPLGGSREGRGRTVYNLIIVWAFTGFWHGTGGNYVLWAMILVSFIIAERFWLGEFLRRHPVFAHFYTIFVILISWVPFAIGDISEMIVFLGRLFAMSGTTINSMDFIIQCRGYVWPLLMGVLLCTPIPRRLWQYARGSPLSDILLFALFWVSVYYVATAAQDPFLYFQF